jgi:plastocyanin
VTIANFAFSPSNTTVSSGSAVTWTNNDTVSHTVTADNGSFDSGVLQPGATFTHTFTQAGSVPYHCSIHPSMHGSVSVQ